MSKRGFKGANSVTLRLFPGAKAEEAVFDVVKVSGNPSSINIESLVDSDVKVDGGEKEFGNCETFDGYFPDDGYDYTQHLRDINQERFVPVLRKAPETKIDLNAELVEVMEALKTQDEGAYDEIDSSFVGKLGPVDERTRLAMLWGEDQVEEYLSMPTEKLMAINERLKDLERSAAKRSNDKEFDDFFLREFDDAQIGGLSAEDIEIDSEGDLSVSDDSEDETEETADEEDPEKIRMECLEETKRFVEQHVLLQQSVMDQPDDMNDIIRVPVRNVPEWDCESVLSGRSNLYNHPGLIERPKREMRARRIPDQAVIAEEDESEEVNVVSTLRKSDESPEERRIRKKAIKGFQREQRLVKKTLKAKEADFVNKQKQMIAVSKHSSYGDIPTGVAKFRV